MRIESVYTVKGRGVVAYVTLEANGPQPGHGVRRRSDGRFWQIRGVEWWAMPRTPERPGKGDKVGLLLSDGGDPREGDDVDIVTHVILWNA